MITNERIIELIISNSKEYIKDVLEDIAVIRVEDFIEELQSELKKLRVADVSFECTHENTEFKHIRCNVCTDCGELVEIDV